MEIVIVVTLALIARKMAMYAQPRLAYTEVRMLQLLASIILLVGFLIINSAQMGLKLIKIK